MEQRPKIYGEPTIEELVENLVYDMKRLSVKNADIYELLRFCGYKISQTAISHHLSGRTLSGKTKYILRAGRLFCDLKEVNRLGSKW